MNSPADELALLGNAKQQIVILGKKFVLKTLDSDAEASAQSAASLFDAETRKRIIKLEKLARAIESIDGVPFSVSQEEVAQGRTPVSKARESIYKWHAPVVDRVFAEYEKMEKQREAVVAELEKNGPSPLTSSGAGK